MRIFQAQQNAQLMGSRRELSRLWFFVVLLWNLGACVKKSPFAQDSQNQSLVGGVGRLPSYQPRADQMARERMQETQWRGKQLEHSAGAVLKQQIGFSGMPLTKGAVAQSKAPEPAPGGSKNPNPLAAREFSATLNRAGVPGLGGAQVRSGSGAKEDISFLHTLSQRYQMGDQNPGDKLSREAHLDAVVRTAANYYFADAQGAAMADALVGELKARFTLNSEQERILRESKAQGPELWD